MSRQTTSSAFTKSKTLDNKYVRHFPLHSPPSISMFSRNAAVNVLDIQKNKIKSHNSNSVWYLRLRRVIKRYYIELKEIPVSVTFNSTIDQKRIQKITFRSPKFQYFYEIIVKSNEFICFFNSVLLLWDSWI